MIIGINCGHTASGPGSGALGYLEESKETRAVGYKLMEYLKKAGHTVVDCTDDVACSTGENLREICRLANAQPLDMFISIHFNAGRGEGAEVFTYGKGDFACAKKMKSALYKLGFRDRGIKDGSHLYVIKNTKAPAALVEVCFVDTKTDADLYQSLGADKVAKALAEAITGEKLGKEELTVTQYEELKKQFEDLNEQIKFLIIELKSLKNPMVYNYIDDNMPSWARPTIQKLVDKGILKGDEEGKLNLDDNILRILVINDRAGIYN